MIIHAMNSRFPRLARVFQTRQAQYVLATAIVLVALSVRFSLSGPFTQFAFPFIFFFPAVLATAFATSLWPSVYASFLSVALASFFFVEPLYNFIPVTQADAIGLAFFTLLLLVDCVVIHVAKQSIQRLKAAQEELRVADTRKNEFLGFMAHELRNPLSIIKNSGQLLAQGANGKAARWLEIQRDQVFQMERLTNDLLDGARLASGKMYVEMAPMDLVATVTATVEGFRLIVQSRQQSVTLHTTLESLPIVGDAARLRQVIENLLSNASKFSPDGSEIRVFLEADHRCATVKVVDAGKGLAPDSLERIFAMYYQTSEQDHRLGGLGLGLPLARHIALEHSGNLRAQSAGRDQGATFVLILPLGPA